MTDVTSHTLRLLYGDKRNPTRTLNLANLNTGNISVSEFTPAPGQVNILWSGPTLRNPGQKRLASSPDNATLTLKYHLSGANGAVLARAQQAIDRFVEDCRLWEEGEQGAPVYLEYRWADGLKNLTAPTWGQLSHYYQVYDIRLTGWPDSLHSTLTAGWVKDAELKLTCCPLPEGLDQWALWADAAPSTGTATLYKAFTTEMQTDFTVAGWVTHKAANYALFEYYVDASNYVYAHWNNAAGTMNAVCRVGGVTTTLTNTVSLSAGNAVHVAVTNSSAGNKVLYVNGSAIHTLTGFTNPASGTFRLGYSSVLAATKYTDTHDGWRVWATALTATELAQLYTNESAVKSAGYSVQPFPYWLTKAGDGVLHNVDGTLSGVDKQNWGYVAGVSGDAEALTEWQIQLPTSSPARVAWLGVKPRDSVMTPYGSLWLDFIVGGVADTGNSSDDSYATATTSGSGTDTYTFSYKLSTPAYARGRVQMLARFKCTGSAVDVTPFFQLGTGDKIYGKTTRISTNANFLFRDFGDLYISWQQAQPGEVKAGLYIEESAASAATVQLDFIQLLPYENGRVEAQQATLTVASGDLLYIKERWAWLANATRQVQAFEFTGNAVNVHPNRFNYAFLLMAEEGQQYSVSQSATVNVKITPRGLMPGGAL